MSFRDDDKVILEVSLNGDVGKDHNPHVPYGVDETARDVVDTIQRGAGVVHFNARYDDGRQAWTDADISRAVLAAAARDVDPLAYPSYSESLDHVWDLAAQPPEGVAQLLAPFEAARHSSGTLWNEDTGRFEPAASRPDDTNTACPPELDQFQKLGLSPSISVFNAVDLRWVLLAARIGMLRQPLNIKLFFSDSRISYSEPDPAVLDFLVSRIPKWIDHEIVVVPYAMSNAERCQELWEYALERKLGIRVGIADNPMLFRTAGNGELVDKAVKLIAKQGLGVATTQDIRARFAAPERDETELIRVVVNRNRCLGWGVCYNQAPEIYQADAEGFCVVTKAYVNEAQLDAAIQGAASCPERAIKVELCDDETKSVHAQSGSRII